MSYVKKCHLNFARGQKRTHNKLLAMETFYGVVPRETMQITLVITSLNILNVMTTNITISTSKPQIRRRHGLYLILSPGKSIAKRQ